MRLLAVKALIPAFVISLSLLAYGGVGGITVPNGTYTFKKDPGNTTVASGQFVGGSENKLILNPGPNAARYTQDSMSGSYDRDNNDHQSICFHAVDGLITYQNKFDGGETSHGHLEP